MSRPSFFSTFRSALPRRPLGRTMFSPFAWAGPRAGPSNARHASGVVSTSLRSTLFRPITVVLLFAPILTGYLGVWQLQRLQWKLDLIDEIDRNISKDPILLPAHVNMGALPEFAFRRVLLRGKFIGPPILQGPQTRDGIAGYHLIQPFDRSSTGGSTILVNRGFILTAEGEKIRTGEKPVPGLGADGSPSGEVIVEAMLTKRDPNAKSYFTPDNQPERNEWFWKDVPEMTEWVGGEEKGVQPLLVDVIDKGEAPASMLLSQGIPVGRSPQIELRNQHMTYAITWFSLCAATSVMLGLVIRQGRTKKLPNRRAFREGR